MTPKYLETRAAPTLLTLLTRCLAGTSHQRRGLERSRRSTEPQQESGCPAWAAQHGAICKAYWGSRTLMSMQVEPTRCGRTQQERAPSVGAQKVSPGNPAP